MEIFFLLSVLLPPICFPNHKVLIVCASPPPLFLLSSYRSPAFTHFLLPSSSLSHALFYIIYPSSPCNIISDSHLSPFSCNVSMPSLRPDKVLTLHRPQSNICPGFVFYFKIEMTADQEVVEMLLGQRDRLLFGLSVIFSRFLSSPHILLSFLVGFLMYFYDISTRQ